jgi:hypothetical protein
MLLGTASWVESEPMDAQRIYRTYRRYVLDLAEKSGVPVDEALRALARTASQCNPNLADFEIARYIRTQTEEWLVQSKRPRPEYRETG